MHLPRDPAADLRRIAFLLERSRADTYRVRAYRTAAAVVAALTPEEVAQRVERGTLTSLRGIGASTAAVVSASAAGITPDYLRRLEDESRTPLVPLVPAAQALMEAMQGDCHVHSDWSDGGSPPRDMALAARDDVGHSWAVLTDHSPRLTVARGLSADRLRAQIELVEALNTELAPFRLLTGIEVDINPDGTLDQEPELLGRLDVVVGSVHSELRMPAREMTVRLLRAVADPHLDVLGHCTGRLLEGPRSPRPESVFDAERVLDACATAGVALEVNARPERLDPPRRLLRQAVEAGCLLAVDTDAHAPGQLSWQPYGTARAAECGAPVDSVVTTWSADRVLEWARSHR